MTSAVAWAKSPRPAFSVGVHIEGAGHHPYLGVFRCNVLPAGQNATGTCTHLRDRHADHIAVQFNLVSV